MDRLQKKCFMASTGTHALLACILMFGSAFFIPSQKPVDVSQLPKMKVIPGKLVDDLLSGGGGNPNIKPSDERLKGDTTRPVDPPPRLETPPPTKQPENKPPEPKQTKQADRVEKVEKEAPAKQDKPLPLVPTVRNRGKELVKVTPNAKDDISQFLKPASKSPRQKAREAAEAAAQEFAKAEGARRAELSKALGKATDNLRSGFKDGTIIDVNMIGGPGGEAYANYAQFVKEIYDDAWDVPPDFIDEKATTKVTIVIERSGNVVSARITGSSGNSTLDRSVQRALDRVKFVHEFPEGAKEQKRTYTINFNLKAKQLG